jgi:hypothetical protein
MNFFYSSIAALINAIKSSPLDGRNIVASAGDITISILRELHILLVVLVLTLCVTNSSLFHLSILHHHHHVTDHQKPIHQTTYQDAGPGPKLFQILSHDIIGYYSFSHMTSSL